MGVIALSKNRLGTPGPSGTPGVKGDTGSGAQGLWQPPDNGLVAAPHDPNDAQGNTTLSAGFLYFVRVKMAAASVITNVHLLPRTPTSVALTNCYLGVYSFNGTTATLLGQTADISSTLTGDTGAQEKWALTSPTASQAAGTSLLLAVLIGGATTVPTVFAKVIGRTNHNLTGTSPYRSGISGTAQTALPSTFALSATSGGGAVPWLGLS